MKEREGEKTATKEGIDEGMEKIESNRGDKENMALLFSFPNNLYRIPKMSAVPKTTLLAGGKLGGGYGGKWGERRMDWW